MKITKNKEIVIGLIILILLGILAIVLIVKREFPSNQNTENQIIAEEIEFESKNEQKAQESEAKLLTDNVNQLEDTDLDLSSQKKESADSSTQVNENEEMNKLGLDKFADNQTEFYTAPVYAEYTGEEIAQLEELYYYWNDYKLDAVDDLIRLPRLRTAFTNELAGTNGFYYYGTLDKNGLPSGNGVAVYANNAYYCGEWKNGKRHGNGMWLQIYPDKPATLNGVSGVMVHSYNGQWQNDLPNGEGQEHFEYDLEIMEGNDEVITNVIGKFKDGYYDDELYIMLMDEKGESSDWEATAQKGIFNYYHNRYNASDKLPVWKSMENEEEDEYIWMAEKENSNWGIFGLKK